MTDFRTITKTYFVTRKNKRSSHDSVMFELHWQRNVLRLVRDINNHTLQPTSYTFVSRYPRPREIFASSMEVRIANHYIDIRLRPLIENRLTDRTFNNRKGMGLNAAVRQIEEDMFNKTCGYTKDAYIISWDLKGYFPNASQDIAYKQYEDIALNDYKGDDIDDLIYLLNVSIFAYPTLHCTMLSTPEERALIQPEKSLFTKPLGIGGTIGNLQWQNGMNLYTDSIDHWLQECCGILHVRYVDDNEAITDNKTAFLTYVMPELRKRYAELGCTMHPKKFYCQHYSKGVKFCGYTIKPGRVYPNPASIGRCRQKIYRINRTKATEDKLLGVLSSINSYIGIFKNCNGYAITRNMVGAIGERWRTLIEFDEKRVCLVAKDGHRLHDRLKHKYNLKLSKRYDKARKRRSSATAERAAATSGCNNEQQRCSRKQVHQVRSQLLGDVPRRLSGIRRCT